MFWRQQRRVWAASKLSTASPPAEDVIRLGRHVVCSRGAESDARDHLSLTLDFITENEETEMMSDVEMTFRRRKYEYDHWDRVSYNRPMPRSCILVCGNIDGTVLL